MKKFSLSLILLTSLILTVAITHSQSVFEKSYPVNINNELNYRSKLMTLPDSSFLFATTSYNNANNSVLVGRIDHAGTVLWVDLLDDNFLIGEVSFNLSPQGFLYISYGSQDSYSLKYYSVIVKSDVNGNIIWTKKLGNSITDQRCQKIFLTSNSIYVAGEVCSGAPCDFFVQKLDTSGNFDWGITYDAGGYDYLREAIQLSNHDILLSALTMISSNHYCTSLLRIDSNGSIVWHKRFHLPSYKEFNSQALAENFDGSLLIAGHADSVDVPSSIYFGLWDMSLMKLTAGGNFLWGKIYGGADWDEFWRVIPTDDHGFAMAAEPESFGNVSRIGLMKIDSDGNFNWMKLYGNATGGFPNNMVINQDKGYTFLAMDGDYSVIAPMVFIRTDSLGNSICPNSNVVLPQLSFTPIIDSIISTGTVAGDTSFTPFAAGISLSPTNYCIPNSIQVSVNDDSFTLSPNPVQNLLTINFPSPSAASTLAVYDAIGRKVKSCTLPSHQKTFELSVAELPAGVYLVAVNSGGPVWGEMVVKE